MKTGKDKLAYLRREIARMEAGRATPKNGAARGASRPFPGPLASPRLHEIVAGFYGDLPAAMGFCLALLQYGGEVPALWCQSSREAGEFGRPFGPGLYGFGLAPAHLVFVSARRDKELLWAAEEGVRSGALSAVVLCLPYIDLTASRRLNLAASEHGAPCFLLRPHGSEAASAAWTRWRVSAAPSRADGWATRGLGPPAWAVTCLRDRSVPVRAESQSPQLVEWDHETNRFRLASSVADRPAATEPRADKRIPFIRAG